MSRRYVVVETPIMGNDAVVAVWGSRSGDSFWDERHAVEVRDTIRADGRWAFVVEVAESDRPRRRG